MRLLGAIIFLKQHMSYLELLMNNSVLFKEPHISVFQLYFHSLKGLVKLIKGVKIAHSVLQFVSN